MPRPHGWRAVVEARAGVRRGGQGRVRRPPVTRGGRHEPAHAHAPRGTREAGERVYVARREVAVPEEEGVRARVAGHARVQDLRCTRGRGRGGEEGEGEGVTTSHAPGGKGREALVLPFAPPRLCPTRHQSPATHDAPPSVTALTAEASTWSKGGPAKKTGGEEEAAAQCTPDHKTQGRTDPPPPVL